MDDYMMDIAESWGEMEDSAQRAFELSERRFVVNDEIFDDLDEAKGFALGLVVEQYQKPNGEWENV